MDRRFKNEKKQCRITMVQNAFLFLMLGQTHCKYIHIMKRKNKIENKYIVLIMNWIRSNYKRQHLMKQKYEQREKKETTINMISLYRPQKNILYKGTMLGKKIG